MLMPYKSGVLLYCNTVHCAHCGDAELPRGDVGSMRGGALIAGVNEA
jgi:hypothetical protein